MCDPIWHVSSSSGVATSVSELLSVLLYFNEHAVPESRWEVLRWTHILIFSKLK